MYCGSCLHDNTLAAALLDLGEDVRPGPHLHADPHRRARRQPSAACSSAASTSTCNRSGRSFAARPGGSIGCSIIRRCSKMLSQAGRRASTRRDLGDMTVSMLSGEAGNQRKELEKLVDWLITDVRPDVVHLSNSMLIGMARMLKRHCGPPVVCQLSGEDLFLEKLPPPYYEQARVAAPRAGRRRRCLRRHQPLLRRLHGRLSGRRPQQSPRRPSRPQARRPRQAARKEP